MQNLNFKFKINYIDKKYEINEESVSLEEFKAFCKKNSPPGVKFYECPKFQGNPIDPISCMFCCFGHMTECHYPDNCLEAQCEHYKNNLNQNNQDES